MKPLLQVALDQTSLEDAVRAVTALQHEVDVVEAGTILCFAEGLRCVSILRALCPTHTIVADLKVADAGQVLAQQAFRAGADWMTVICNAPTATKQKAQKVAEACGGAVQIELYGHWTLDDASEWLRLGIQQAIYHRGRDAELAGQSWSDADVARIRELTHLGFEVSVTGGLTCESLQLFQGIPVKCFIAGRSLYLADQPAAEARAFQEKIARLWS